jgi:DHA1 family tetracycline resistance protein-like MFS transporter
MDVQTSAGAPAPAHSVEPQTRTKRALGLIFFITLMDVVGMTILFPVAPYVVGRYSSDALMVTMLTVIYAAAQFVAAPILGKLSDRYGRRPVLLVSVLGSAIGYFVFGIGGALWVLFAARLIDGITAGNQSTAMAYLADVSKPEERAKTFTLVGMAFGLGFILGPALGGALGQVSLDAPAFLAGAVSLANVILIALWLPESLPAGRRERSAFRVRDLNPLVSISEIARKPGMALLLLAFCLFTFAFDGANTVITVFLVQKFFALPWQMGLLMVLSGIAMAFVQGGLVNKLVPRFGEKAVAATSLLGLAASYLAIVVAPAFWMIFPIEVLGTSAAGFIWPTFGSLTTNRVSEQEQGKLAGVNAALGSLMSVFGPLTAGASFDHVMPGAPFILGAVVIVAAALVLARVKHSAGAQRQVQSWQAEASA